VIDRNSLHCGDQLESPKRTHDALLRFFGVS
jgi:hypothetical protein